MCVVVTSSCATINENRVFTLYCYSGNDILDILKKDEHHAGPDAVFDQLWHPEYARLVQTTLFTNAFN